MKKTVLITLRYGLAARNVLRTGTFKGLKGAGHRIVIVCPAAHEQYLIDEVANSQVILEPYPKIQLGKAERYFAGASNILLFDHPGVTNTLTSKWLHSLTESRYSSFLAKWLLGYANLHRSERFRILAERIDSKYISHPEVGDIIERHRPSLVVTTDLFSSECHFVREARRRGIQSVCLVKSWDNLTSKSRIRVHPEYIVVWSDLMKEEALNLHFYPPERIFVSGSPNFDFFKDGAISAGPREQFLRSIGADEDSKLVVYSPGYKLTFSDDENIRLIHRVLKSGALGVKCHLHIRKYPKSPQDFSHLLDLPGVTVEDAGIVIPSWGDRVDQTYEQIIHLGKLVRHADVLIQIGSTIAIDAACFDTPIIGYFLHAQDPGPPRWHFARRTFDLTHNRYLTDLGGVRVVLKEKELIQALQDYLHHPELDREGRRRIVERICGRFDGHSGDRVAAFLLALLNRTSADVL